MSTRTYYRGPDAVVTDAWFVWLTGPTARFAVRDLRNVVRTRNDRFSRYSAFVAGGAMVMVAAAWTTLGTPAAYVLGALAVTVPTAAVVVSRRASTHSWQLMASYRGAEVVLYSCRDERVFNQVTRALKRSMEDARSPAGDYGLAPA